MKTKNLTLLIMGVVLQTIVCYGQKDYVNQEWNKITDSIGTINRAISAIDSDKNLIVVSNALNSSNDVDVLISKYSPDGTLIWKQTYNGLGNGNDYGVQLKINNANEIFVAAALHGVNTGLDFGILKYSSNGNLIWDKSWNGQANGIDIPSGINIDNSGNIFIVGGTESPNGFSDYAILKFNSNGIYQWHTIYDYSNLHDAAANLAFSGNNLIVSGASASTLTNWDYATLLINKDNGVVLDVKRTLVPGVGLDNVMAVTSDGNNNIYITGYTEMNGNRNFQTIKIDEQFNLVWVKNFDGGFEDIAKAIGIDDFGNVYVVGTKGNSNGGKDYMTIKYNANGTEIWRREFGSGGNGNLIAEAEHLSISDNGDVIITGTVEKENNKKEFATIKYTSNGMLKFVEKFDAGQHDNEAKSVVISDDNIYVSGIAKVGGISRNTTIKYNIINRTMTPHIVNGEEEYIQNEIIVRFNKSVLNLDLIDRKSMTAGKLDLFIKPEVIQQLNDSTNYDWNNFIAYKIHKGVTSYDTVSYTRFGDTISLSSFWASLVIELPKSLDQDYIINILRSIEGIQDAQLNFIYKPSGVPNDPGYNNNQLGFHPNSTYPNSDINVIGAWDLLESKGLPIGSSDVKVGVFDYLIDYSHVEFSSSNGVGGSKIKYGKNYHNGNLIEDDNLQYTATSHGTSVAGIIAANRNNGIGVAGIAGGDLLNSPTNYGVDLYSIGIHWVSGLATSDIIVEALTESSVATNTGYGNGINIANHSYGSSSQFQYGSPDIEVMKALNNSWRNGTVNIVARGNQGGTNPIEYPACYADKLVINVVASGTDGERKTVGNGDLADWQSSYGISANNPSPGCNVDVMAPGVLELISTTVNAEHLYFSDFEQSLEFQTNCLIPLTDPNNNKFSCFAGTSAATAHVTGVAALMYSAHDPNNSPYYKNKLSTEDIEQVLQKTTFKIPHNYSNNDGYGLINSEEAVRQVVLPYSVYHLSSNLSNATITQQGVYNSNGIYITEFTPGPITNPNSGLHNISGPYTKKTLYKAKWNINYTPTDGQIIDWWDVSARTSGGQPAGKLNQTNHGISSEPIFYQNNLNVDYVNNTVTGTIEAYYYRFQNSLTNLESWLPSNPQMDLRYTIALHLKGDNDLGVRNVEEQYSVSVFPNPSNSEVYIRNVPLSVGKYNIHIYDASGRLIESKLIIDHAAKIDVSSLSHGLYIFHLEGDNFNAFPKFIKQ